ncbi:transcriptional regulator [Corynebacterium tuberculostearicum]|uniref:transcriptional regulator n=1 Tax=Corynebacterium tuberculostearicum TaxID=38304 RepID=UPI0038D253C7
MENSGGKLMEFVSALQGLRPLVHSPKRLAVMACLNSVDTANYQTLKAYMGVDYPALSKAVGALEEAGLVKVTKTFEGKVPVTDLSLSRKGRKVYSEYLQCLDRIVVGFRQ